MTEDVDVGYELAWRDAWDVFVATQHPPVPHETNTDLVIAVGFAAYQKGRAAAQEDVLFGLEVRSEIRKLFETLTGYHIGDADVTDVVDAADNLKDVVLHRPAIEAAIRGTEAGLDVDVWVDVVKFIRWSANVRDDTVEAIAVAKALLDRIEAALSVPAPTLPALDAETLRRAINASHETERPIDLHAAENILEALRDAV